MAFFKIKRMQHAILMISGILFAVSMVAGCVVKKSGADKSEDQVNSEKVSPGMVRQLDSVSIVKKDPRGIDVLIKGNQKLTYTSIKQAFPFGIAVYLPETEISDDFQKKGIIDDRLNEVQVGYADEEKTTVKVEILLNRDLNYEVVETDTVIRVALSGGLADPQAVAMADTGIKPPSFISGADPEDTNDTLVIPDKTAVMRHIAFNTLESGKSDIVVYTDHPVKYDVDQKGDDTICLNLYNTVIPEYHKRPLLTQYFKSAVESLMPRQVPGKDKNSKVDIKIRQAVPYRIVQNRNTISLFFEPASIEPPVFSKAIKKISGDTLVEKRFDPSGQTAPNRENEIPVEKPAEEDRTANGFLVKKKYTGEKIKLDFYETDIKNVFRILRSVGGANFAIDKNVEGKVTLTLEDPVPWDQVLDLVLKMNNLGQKKEGNVTRIATLEKLKEEEQLIQEAIAARKETLAKSKALEPLITEYIPINYSDAQKDIKPHVEQILTANRGKISVDVRTNMIIITDTKEKIDQAKEIIYRLDKVTPQIMIEAKVVEVTKDFSRELGMGLSFNKTATAHTGRDTDFSVALNHPISDPGTNLSFNFYRLFGSDFLNLKAQLAASEKKGDVKIVSSPRILTLDNKKAKIKQGLEYAYLERDDSGGSSVKFKNIDLLLEVTPHVTPDKRIAMTVYVTKNDVDTVNEGGVPSLATNEAQTELLVNNNDTVVIGGIVKTSDTKGSAGTPILSGIPILGRLFRTDTTKDKRNELLIFLTPSIVQLEQRRNTFTTVN